MAGVDDEFEDFLKRRKPAFRSPDDLFEPPAELDRVVLRQAREAIEADRPVKVFHGPRWAAPIALAATLLLAVTIIFQAGMPAKQTPVPEVTVQNVAERVEMADAAAPMAPAPSVAPNNQARESAAASDTVVVDLANPMMAKREPAAGAAPEAERQAVPSRAPMVTATPSAFAEVPYWRLDAKSWQAEIQRLRDAGDNARADAEAEEFKRQQRAYAGAPDR